MTLETLLQKFSQANKDKKIIYPNIDDDRTFQAVTQLFQWGDIPVICWKKHELDRYAPLVQEGLLYYEVPDDQKNEVFAAEKLQLWEVDGFLWGNISSSSDIARALIKTIGVSQDVSRASSHFLLGKWDEMIIFTDAGFQIDPDASQLSEIAFLVTQQALKYGMNPQLAFLSFSTAWSGWEHPKITKMKEATEITKELFQQRNLWHIPIEWEIQFDAAFIPEIGQRKKPDITPDFSANIFVFPDLDAANIAYKIAQRVGGYTALWPIFQGFSKPANDLSRGCSVSDIVTMHHLTKNM